MIYMGSKSRIAKHIVPILQSCINENNINTYIETFVGGANVIDKIQCEYKIGYDINSYLIELLKHTRDNYDKSDCFPIMVEKDYYYKVKESYKNKTDEFSELDKAIVGFLASWYGRIFNGYTGIKKMKDGSVKNYYERNKRNLIKQGANLNKIHFAVQSYEQLSKDTKNALIYCDPPYENTRKYTGQKIDYNSFWDWVREISLYNYVFVSSINAPNDFITVWGKENVYRFINNNNNDKTKSFSSERLFVYKNGIANNTNTR